MEIVSQGMCRAAGKVYEKLSVTGLPKDAALRPCLPDTDAQHVLPHWVFALEPSSEEPAFVAVYPIPPADSATYSFCVLSEARDVVARLSHKVDFTRAKWESRYNYRVRKSLCDQIRLYDDTHESESPHRINVTAVMGTPNDMIVRLDVVVPKEDACGPARLLCLDAGLSPVEIAPISMGSSVQPGRVAPSIQERHDAFSIRLPWNQDVLYLMSWVEGGTGELCCHALTRSAWEAALRKSDWTFLSAGADPYYHEWFQAHKATPWELVQQRSVSFPQPLLFSLIVPLYKTPEPLFRDMLSSVLAQSYENWELILVNASPEEERLSQLVGKAAADDSRVRVVTLEKNEGISLNTNAGIAAAHGDFIGFLDHDDVIEPNLLYEYAKAIHEEPDTDLLYCDEDKLMPDGQLARAYFKPELDIDLLRSNNYICHLLCIRASLLATLEPNTPEFDGAQDHNLTLQAVEHARRVTHVPQVLYHWRVCETSSAADPSSKLWAQDAGIKAVSRHLSRLGLDAQVTPASRLFTYEVRYAVPRERPLVSVIIPTSDHVETLRNCLESIFDKTTYENYEIVLVENNSKDPETFAYYDELVSGHPDKVRVVRWSGTFSYSSVNNFGVSQAQGDYLLFLNNDTQVITPDWMERMLGNAARRDVGCVGVRLFFPDDTIQHAGVLVTDGIADHFFQNLPRGTNWGYFNLADTQRDLSAVTAACMMARRDVFELVGGFEEQLPIAFNDVDFCLKCREKDLLVVYTPLVELYHFESLSRGLDVSSDKRLRSNRERAYLLNRWAEHFSKADPYFTPCLQETHTLARQYHF